jgi:UDP-glucose 4-epimerase
VLTETARIVGKVPHQVGARRPGDSPRLVGNVAKSKAELGWTPAHDLAAQIEHALRWRRTMPRQ